MKIAIIGCGYVGSAIARKWSSEGHTLTVTTTTPDRLPELEKIAARAWTVKGNDFNALMQVVAEQEVILLSVGSRSPADYRETYLGTSTNLLAALEESPTVKQVIYTSSYSVYGDQKGKWVNENSPVNLASEKDEILYKAERVLLAAGSQFPDAFFASGNEENRRRVCVLRLGGIYGPGRGLDRIFGRIAGKTRPGSGEYFTNWVHLDDIVGALEFARAQQLEGVYNLVGDVPAMGRELVAAVCDRYNLAPVSWDPSQPDTRTLNVKVSNQKLKAAGFEFVHPEVMSSL